MPTAIDSSASIHSGSSIAAGGSCGVHAPRRWPTSCDVRCTHVRRRVPLLGRRRREEREEHDAEHVERGEERDHHQHRRTARRGRRPTPRRESLPSTGTRRRAECPPATACRRRRRSPSAACGAPARPCAGGRCCATAWITAPAPRNSSALNTPCVSRWKKPAAGEAGADRRHHVAELRDGGIREHALDVVLHAREHRRQQRGERADPRDDQQHVRRQREQPARARCSRYTPAVTIVAA